MRIETHKSYTKMWVKLAVQQQKRAIDAINMFTTGNHTPALRLHQLKGEYYPQYSISAGGDLRIHFVMQDKDKMVLLEIGTHSQLYG